MPVRYSSSHDDSRRDRPTRGSNIKRRQDSSLSRSPLIWSSLVLWFPTSAILAVGLVVLLVRKRRQERAVAEFSEQVWQLTREASAAGRIGLEGGNKSLGQLRSAVNKLL